MGDSASDKALQQFADLMVKKIDEVSDNYKNPWFSSIGHGLPQNLEGRVFASGKKSLSNSCLYDFFAS